MTAFRHLAVFVPDLREAERFYQDVFAMRLLMREAEMDDHLWYTLPFDKGWDDAAAADIDLDMIALKRDEFVLALFRGEPAAETTLLEIGISMTPETIAAVRDRLPDTVQIVDHVYDDLLFNDPFGYRWHMWPAGVAFQSNGETAGRWLDL